MWHASVAVYERVRRKGYRNTSRTLPLSALHPDELALCESVALQLLAGAGQPPDAVGVDLSAIPDEDRLPIPETCVHRRRRLSDEEMLMLSPEFMAAVGSPACPAMVME